MKQQQSRIMLILVIMLITAIGAYVNIQSPNLEAPPNIKVIDSIAQIDNTEIDTIFSHPDNIATSSPKKGADLNSNPKEEKGANKIIKRKPLPKSSRPNSSRPKYNRPKYSRPKYYGSSRYNPSRLSRSKEAKAMVYKINSITYHLRLETSEFNQSKKRSKRDHLLESILFAEKEVLFTEASLTKFEDEELVEKKELFNSIRSLKKTIDEAKKAVANVEERTLKVAPKSNENAYLNSFPSFPDTVPLTSCVYKLDDEIFSQKSTLGEIQTFLDKSLKDSGYDRKSYFKINSKNGNDFAGFTIVAQIEQIDKEAYPLSLPARWEIKYINEESFSVNNILQILFGSNPGFYRVVVFHVSNEPFIQETRIEKKMKLKDAEMLAAKGASSLAPTIQAEEFTPDYICNLLIYEFEIPESGGEPFLRVPSPHSGEIHINRSGLQTAIKSRIKTSQN